MNGVWLLRGSCAVTTTINTSINTSIITQQGETAPLSTVLPLQRLNTLPHLSWQLQAERIERTRARG
jgi:hypothetical protein